MKSRIVKMVFAILPLALIYSITAEAQKPNQKLLDKELSAVIFNDVLAKDYKGFPIVVTAKNTSTDIKYILASKPNEFFDNVRSMFGVTEDSEVQKLLSTGYSLNLPPKPDPKNSSSVTDAPNKHDASSKQSNDTVIVDVLVVLYKKAEEKCLVYFHVVHNGTNFATLEKKNGLWKVTEIKNMTLE